MDVPASLLIGGVKHAAEAVRAGEPSRGHAVFSLSHKHPHKKVLTKEEARDDKVPTLLSAHHAHFGSYTSLHVTEQSSVRSQPSKENVRGKTRPQKSASKTFLYAQAGKKEGAFALPHALPSSGTGKRSLVRSDHHAELSQHSIEGVPSHKGGVSPPHEVASKAAHHKAHAGQGSGSLKVADHETEASLRAPHHKAEISPKAPHHEISPKAPHHKAGVPPHGVPPHHEVSSKAVHHKVHAGQVSGSLKVADHETEASLRAPHHKAEISLKAPHHKAEISLKAPHHKAEISLKALHHKAEISLKAPHHKAGVPPHGVPPHREIDSKAAHPQEAHAGQVSGSSKGAHHEAEASLKAPHHKAEISLKAPHHKAGVPPHGVPPHHEVASKAVHHEVHAGQVSGSSKGAHHEAEASLKAPHHKAEISLKASPHEALSQKPVALASLLSEQGVSRHPFLEGTRDSHSTSQHSSLEKTHTRAEKADPFKLVSFSKVVKPLHPQKRASHSQKFKLPSDTKKESLDAQPTLASQPSSQNPASLHTLSHNEAPQHLASAVRHQVTLHVRHAQDTGQKTLSFHLHPKDLGRVHIQMHFDSSGRVTASLTVEHSQALAVLKHDAPQLMQSLQDAGVHVSSNGLSFHLNQEGQNKPFLQQERKKHKNQRLSDSEERYESESVAPSGRIDVRA